MRLGSHVAEDSVTSLATTAKTSIEDKRPLVITGLMAEVWRHVLTSNLDKVVSERPGFDSGTAV